MEKKTARADIIQASNVSNEDTLTPKVDETQEFIEIAFDFANPLDLIREAISNAFDAGADHIRLVFDVIKDCGDDVFRIFIQDNGSGMDREGLQSFFDLGNSTRRQLKQDNADSNFIGEKGHGTKIYFNCDKLIVETLKNGTLYRATMEKPKRLLYSRKIPTVKIEQQLSDDKAEHFTKITILGYNSNKRELFTHERLRDYIIWFTKMGSVEKEFGILSNVNVKLELKGLNYKKGLNHPEEYDVIDFGHEFAQPTTNIAELKETKKGRAPRFYCKRFPKEKHYHGYLENSPEIEFDAVFYIEGDSAKREYNKMLRGKGINLAELPAGAYTVQERYGLWICKDYIPIQKKNEWISKKGNEYTKFHAFINCQALKLTANRGSIENTPTAIIEDLKKVVEKYYDEIINSDEFEEMASLEAASAEYTTREKEEKDYNKRIKKINETEIAYFDGLKLIQPQQENGTYSMFLLLSQKCPDLFPFEIVDYNTHSGIDVIAKTRDKNSSIRERLRYVEFKNILEQQFNHSFENLYAIVCWDIDYSKDDTIEDITDGNTIRTVNIIPARDKNDYTHYYLEDKYSNRKIEVFVLKTYLNEKLGITFRKPNKDECY